MPRTHFRFLLPGLLLLGLTSCDVTPPQGSQTPMSGANQSPADAGSVMEFRGRRPCVDCLGIDAWLRLEHGPSQQRYQLVERYFTNNGERHFEDRGEWAADDDLLRLRSDAGGERVYARMPDGNLQARASNGDPLAAASDDVMVPTDFDGAP